MTNYKESKKKLDEIKRKFCCKGDIIFRTAIQNVVEFGQSTILNADWYQCTLEDIHAKHDNAEKEGKWLFVTRDFELAILGCMKALAEINSYDLLIYIQKEVWLSGDGIDYMRAIEMLKDCINYYTDGMECDGILADMTEELGFSDSEIEELGLGYLFEMED